MNDIKQLKKLYKIRKNPNEVISVPHGLVEDKLGEGWEIDAELKTKTRLIKAKASYKLFEDQVWCQLYDFRYRNLNYDD